jgi:C1A family cysteine protease
MMKLFVIAAIFATSYASQDIYLYREFADYVETYERSYSSEAEYHKRLDIFADNYMFIQEMNQQNHSFYLDVNEFADMHHDEFSSIMLGFNDLKKTSSCHTFESKIDADTLPDSFDWRDLGGVTSVKNQGQCGSCWSFSAAGAMEGSWFINSGTLINISEQQLIDCSKIYGNLGCNGGIMDSAFEYAIDNGMCLYDEVPYEMDTGKCNEVSSCDKIAFFEYCVDVTPNNQVHLKEAVNYAPVSIAIEADTRVFQFYSGGIITSDNCGTTLDHGVLIVAYGEEDGIDYWTVKNSWGSEWGEAGYVRIERSESTNDKGVCGIAMQPSYII